MFVATEKLRKPNSITLKKERFCVKARHTHCVGDGGGEGEATTAFSSRRIMRLKKTWIISDRSSRDEVVALLARGRGVQEGDKS